MTRSSKCSAHCNWPSRTTGEGVAFGIGAGAAPVLVLIAIVGLVLVLLGKQVRLTRVSMVGVGLLLGGAMGNLCDRVFRAHGGAVVDFIDLGWWPVLNAVADSPLLWERVCLCCGDRARPAAE